jgi:uncharacterized membrane protein YbaN (DUF454 family)
MEANYAKRGNVGESAGARRRYRSPRRLLLVLSGFLFLGLGAAGILLPVLPTTPFVLLAAACFSAGSPRIYALLLRNRLFGPYLESYRSGQGISRGRKLSAIIFLWAGLLLSMLIVRAALLLVILPLIGAAVTAHLRLMKTKP